MDIQKPNFKKKPSFLIATFECTFTQLHQCKVAKKSQHYYIIYLIKAFQQVSLSHSMENIVAEVALHNNIEMSKNCQKMPKIAQKLSKIDKKYPKIERLPQQLYFPHCAIV